MITVTPVEADSFAVFVAAPALVAEATVAGAGFAWAGVGAEVATKVEAVLGEPTSLTAAAIESSSKPCARTATLVSRALGVEKLDVRAFGDRFRPAGLDGLEPEGRILAAVVVSELDGRRALAHELGDPRIVLGLLRRDLLRELGIGIGAASRGLSGARRAIESVMAVADADLRLLLRDLEAVGAFLQLAPEGHVRVEPVAREIGRREAEGEGLHLHGLLTARMGLAHQRVDLLDLLIRHGIAAGRRAIAMHHQIGARAAMGAVIGVRIAHVVGQMVIRVRVHLGGRDGVIALGRLPIAFLALRAELARPAAHREGLQKRVAAAHILLPDLELRLLLVGADEDRILLVHALLLHGGEELWA